MAFEKWKARARQYGDGVAVEKGKDHFRKYKVVYSCAATGVVVAGITALIMKGRHARMQSVPDGLARVTMRPFLFCSNGNNIVSTVERNGRGHPGYIVQSLETGARFPTQAETARAFNVSPSLLSSHLNGRFDNVNGLHFERVSLESQE